MASREKYTPHTCAQAEVFPFQTAEEAWFWFVTAQEARADGARFMAGAGLLPRPCEPVDILKAVDRLYRTHRLMREHLWVLRYYGRRRIAPDGRRVKEMRAHTLWREAMTEIAEALEAKGIVESAFRRAVAWHSEQLALEAAE